MTKYAKPTGSYISYMSNLVKEKGGINLAQGIPGFMPPQELLEILSRKAFEDIHQYAPGTGNKKLLKGLVEHYSEYSNFSTDNFLITNGGTEALTIIYTYIMGLYADKEHTNNLITTLAFAPVYEVYNNLPKIFHHHFIAFDYDDNGKINFTQLEEVIRNNQVKAVFINTPGNPYGRFWSKEEFDKIITLSEKLDFYIILDAVYKELYFDSKPYLPLRTLHERVFYTNSFSKVFSVTGWRIGYLAMHSSHIDAIRNIHDYIGLCSPSVLQEALAEYIHDSKFGQDYVSDLRNKLKDAFYTMVPDLQSLGFTVPTVKGGYFIWARLPEQYTDSFEFTMDLYHEEGVAVIPGIHFSDKANNYIRINIARSKEEIREAIQKIKHFINKRSK